MKNLYIALFVLLFSLPSLAQQDPQYTQYMYNMAVINPAYAGSREGISLGALYRNQWTGFDGAPRTFTFFGHSPVGKNVGLGLSLISDQIGPVKETNAYIDFAYTLNLGEKHKLALGLKSGLTFHDIGLLSIVNPTLIDQADEAFSSNVNETTFNVGAGVFFYSDNYYFAVSVPNFLEGTHLDVNGRAFGSEVQHYFITGGYVFQVSPNTKLKPSFLVKSAFGAPTSFDANLNALFFEKFEIGASYRLDDSFSGMVNFAINPRLRIGYAYDAVNSDISSVANASHEVFLLFDLYFPRKVSRSPRYF
ncbi:MAG: type IX secretion system membrane protein PorP/SprF [Bacteroidota bacterium]